MFKKKAPRTVSEALAPFKEVQAGLAQVAAAAAERREQSHQRIADAEREAAEVRKEESAVALEADAEVAQARKVLSALDGILGDG